MLSDLMTSMMMSLTTQWVKKISRKMTWVKAWTSLILMTKNQPGWKFLVSKKFSRTTVNHLFAEWNNLQQCWCDMTPTSLTVLNPTVLRSDSLFLASSWTLKTSHFHRMEVQLQRSSPFQSRKNSLFSETILLSVMKILLTSHKSVISLMMTFSKIWWENLKRMNKTWANICKLSKRHPLAL